MARMPRVVIRGYPHHVTQRGNRRHKTFLMMTTTVAKLILLPSIPAKPKPKSKPESKITRFRYQ